MLLLLVGAVQASETPSWNDTIDSVLDSVVIIHMDRTRPFDGNAQASSEASGFVIDAERGLILTNRHVVTTGPTIAQAIFHNKEEVDLVPLYRDPVHDFGLFRYNPADLEFIQPRSLALDPTRARIGTEIRVIGNDAAEQISILAGTLSRLDRDAPHWDFNTFYLQAASSTSGGSSGSPVFDVDGTVVALNAGARMDAATSLFLPLARVKYAVEALQRGEVPARGTVQTVLAYRTFDELRRLGLTEAVERDVRRAWSGTGMLSVARINAGGPADGALEEGDIVLTLNGEPVYAFERWEAVLDASVGGAVRVGVLRGAERIEVELEVRDLHGLTPSAYFEIGEGVLHPLGYHAAVRVPRATEGVAVARSGRLLASAGIPRDAVIEGVGDHAVKTLDDAVKALSAIPDGERFQVRWTELGTPTQKNVANVLMNRSFWPVQLCTRDAAGAWPCDPVESPPPKGEAERYRVTLATEKKAAFRPVAQSLVTVKFRPQLNVDSIHGNQRESPGLLLDPATGIVLTDRNAVPVTTGEVWVQIGDAPGVPADILYMDPLMNVALVQVDMARLDLGDLQAPELADVPIEVGDSLQLVAIDKEGGVYRQPVDIERLMPAEFPDPAFPRWQVRDVDFVRLGKVDRPTLGGVVCDKHGRVVGLLQRFERDDGNRYKSVVYAVPVAHGLRALDRWKAGETAVPDLGLDLAVRPLVDAREAGLPEAEAARIREHAPDRPMVIEVRGISGDAPARAQLKIGDFVVAAEGQTVTSFEGLRNAVLRRPGQLPLTIVRRGKVEEVVVDSLHLPVAGTERVILWAGALVQEEPPAVAQYSQTPSKGVYLSWYYGGSPAQRYNTGYGRRIVAVDGEPVGSLDELLARVQGRRDRDAVKLRMQGLRGEEWVDTLKLDLKYWPTQEFRRVDGVWQRRELDDPNSPL
ncbi:MAG: trypsin-like peptidase domain-containing protein [Alphaproteobacteria bacterium]|nr:trypsin-like peptidase domain-containing protein [Alphaproteobacteria bacterium]